ncbi:MAG: T9SS type A sorting domain-containing protein [Ignavibacteria bacterium]|nr:T9SS type A sorting domain-containing protein [Ignavibacteria bacterium]
MTSRFFSILKPLIVLFFVCCFTELINAQTYTWEKIYNSSGFTPDVGVCNSEIYNNRYYYVGGRSSYLGYILKVDSRTGDTLWTKKISISGGDIYSIILSPDGGCIFTGMQNAAFTVKLDSTGNVVWNKTYNINDANIKKIIKLSDGNYLLCGSTGFKSGLIIKIDKDGNLIWSRIHNFGGLTSYYSVVELNQKYYLSGTFRTDTSKVLFTSLDTSGNNMNYKLYKFSNSNCDGLDISILSNNLMIICETNYGMYLAKLNPTGVILYEKNIVENNIYSCSKYYNGDFYISYLGITFDSTYNKFSVLDTLGNEVRSKFFRKYIEYEIRDIIVTDKYNFILTGTILNTPGTDDDVYLTRLDSLFSTPIRNENTNIENSFIKAYPNPFNASTTLEVSPSTHSFEITVFDITGKKINSINLQKGMTKVILDFSRFATGTYFIKSNDLTTNEIFFKTLILLK